MFLFGLLDGQLPTPEAPVNMLGGKPCSIVIPWLPAELLRMDRYLVPHLELKVFCQICRDESESLTVIIHLFHMDSCAIPVCVLINLEVLTDQHLYFSLKYQESMAILINLV